MQQNRRNFLKLGFMATGIFTLTSRGLGLFNAAWAQASAHDAKITKQGYTTTLPPAKAADKKKYDRHVTKAEKAKAGPKPNCKNCKHYKPVAAQKGWGKCTMVGATGKPGKFVAEAGWCKVWLINKKAI